MRHEVAKVLLGSAQDAASRMGGTTERRGTERFPIVRDLRYRVLTSRGTPQSGTGKTIDFSSTGVLFSAQAPLPPGRRVELSISWPAQLDGRCALKLVARGRVTRSHGSEVAIEIDKYEFRTQGSRSLSA